MRAVQRVPCAALLVEAERVNDGYRTVADTRAGGLTVGSAAVAVIGPALSQRLLPAQELSSRYAVLFAWPSRPNLIAALPSLIAICVHALCRLRTLPQIETPTRVLPE